MGVLVLLRARRAVDVVVDDLGERRGRHEREGGDRAVAAVHHARAERAPGGGHGRGLQAGDAHNPDESMHSNTSQPCKPQIKLQLGVVGDGCTHPQHRMRRPTQHRDAASVLLATTLTTTLAPSLKSPPLHNLDSSIHYSGLEQVIESAARQGLHTH